MSHDVLFSPRDPVRGPRLSPLRSASDGMAHKTSQPEVTEQPAPEHQRVLVVGGTGRTGARLVQQLRSESGFQVAVLARDPSKAEALFGNSSNRTMDDSSNSLEDV